MKKIILIFFIIPCLANAQNLLVNPGFEDYWPHKYYPPVSYGDTFYAKSWYNVYQGYPSKVNHYFENNIIEFPDGSIKSNNNVPNNSLGYHPPHSGKAYAGLGLIALDGQMCHLTGTLKELLEMGEEYEVSFYIRFAGDKCAVSYTKFEILFSAIEDISSFRIKKNVNEYDSNYENLFKNRKIKGDIVYQNINGYDSANWIKLTEIYKARGDEKYLTIGLFYQGDEISKSIKKMSENYLKVLLYDKKRLRLIKNINKMKIPFIKYNSNFNFKEFKEVHPSGVDGCYYLIDDVSVVLTKRNNEVH